MAGKFVLAREVKPEINDWGKLGWLSNPPNTGAEKLTVIDVTLSPGKGHDFHKHPDQEEVILVVAGKVEQWVDRAALLHHFAVPASRDFVRSLQPLSAAATSIELYDATRLEKL